MVRQDPSAVRGLLKIRLLGELQLAGADRSAIALPASRKTRALLAYLIATGQKHRRERLCDLLWDGPDDPRAELRWCLSKIRSVLEGTAAQLAADREHAGIALGEASVDLLSVRALLKDGIDAATTDSLKQAASLFHGEFLDGLDLPVCYRYQEWCMAEREAIGRLRLSVLGALVGRLQDDPQDALTYARDLAVADPLSETGHAAVIRLLSRLGKHKDAVGHYERTRRMLEIEVGVAPSEDLKEARRELGDAGHKPSVESVRGQNVRVELTQPAATSHLLVGRDVEQALIRRAVAATVKRQVAPVMLITGEAGIGKSRLLDHVADAMNAAGGRMWRARAFEPEAIRPYGIWLDILRAIVGEGRDGTPPQDLGMLLPEFGTAGGAGDQARLFDAVLKMLQQVAGKQPAVLGFDDIQWIDEASASLLHYVARNIDAAAGLLLVWAARSGEIDDNQAVAGVLRSLSRDGRLQSIELDPLDADQTRQLVGSVDARLDAGRIFAESEGNPLFALELARAYRFGEAEPGPTVETVIAGQFARLSEVAREVLVWGAAYGRGFRPDDLARAGRFEAADLLTALAELERRGIVRPADDEYDFAHDLVRQTAYRSVSQPRRKLLHRQIARALDAAGDGGVAAELAYHAGLAGDHALAARACADAGERALQVFANGQATAFAEQGLRHIAHVPEDAAKVETHVRLLKLRILAVAGPGMRRLPPLMDIVTEAANAAEKFGRPAAAATAHYLLSVLHQEAGDTRAAEASTLRAASAGKSADQATRATQLANTARCLLELETEIVRSRELIAESGGLVDPLGIELCELQWARGLLHRWNGEPQQAAEFLGRALVLARRDQDRWREYKCLTWLAMIEQELGRYADMHARCADLRKVAARLGEDETPFVAALESLASLATAQYSAAATFSDALERLRKVDDKSYLAYALNMAARLHLQAGRVDQAGACANEALAAALAMGRANEIAIARAVLARTSGSKPGRNAPAALVTALDLDGLSVRARAMMMLPDG